MDNQIIREVLDNCQKAAHILGTDTEWADRPASSTLDRLPPDQVSLERNYNGVDQGV
ncbi:MAG: hypothetical protein MZV63_60995 [Marinilabiliales bacterium]|nr:hypothetical protein [Marinilabiliales bacterium]